MNINETKENSAIKNLLNRETNVCPYQKFHQHNIPRPLWGRACPALREARGGAEHVTLKYQTFLIVIKNIYK